MGAGGSTGHVAGQHPGHFRHPGLTLHHRGLGHGDAARHLLGHHHLGVRQRGDLRQVGDHQHLMAGAEVGQALPHRNRRGPSDAGIHLVEHQRVRGLREHQAHGQHGAGQFATAGHACQRQQRRARVGCQQERHVVTRIVGPHVHGDIGVRHRQPPQVVLHLFGQLAGALPAGGTHRRCGPVRGCYCVGALGFQFGDPRVVALQFRQPGSSFGLEGQHVGKRVAVLAPQVAEQLQALPHLSQACRILVDAVHPRA